MIRKLAIACVLAAALAAPVIAQSMTNKSVIDLAKAKMSDDVIIAAVHGGAPDFDTSANGLIALKNAGVSDRVIQAMIARQAGGATPAPTAAAAPGGVTPEQVYITDGGSTKLMQYLTPQIRTAARALGLGGVAQYASLRGTAAALRTSTQPTFRVVVPNNAQVDSYVTLASFAVRNNGTREVIIGGGYISYSSGIHKDRVIPITNTRSADQSGAPANSTFYDVTPVKALAKGEYALVLYSSQVRTMGYFASGLDSYYDFGVDG